MESLFFKRTFFLFLRPAGGSAANEGRAYFLKTVISQKYDPPEAAPPTDGELIFQKTIWFFVSKKRPAGGSAANERRAYFKKDIFFEKHEPPEATPPTNGELITLWPIVDYPATYYRLPRDLFRLPAAYYRLPRALLSIKPWPIIYFPRKGNAASVA